MGKSFKSNNPLDALAKAQEPAAPIKKPAADNKKPAKTNSDYLRLDIYGRKDYLQVMAGHRKVSVTKYIQSLIDKDMEQNGETYEKLKSI